MPTAAPPKASRVSGAVAAPKLKRPYSGKLARTFCTLLSESEKSVTALLKEHPEMPHPLTLYKWREKHPYFAALWKRARETQAEHLMQKCLDLAASVTPQNAHAIRIQFDIYKFFGQKLLPALYGDKPATNTQNVNVAVVIPPERLNAIRSKLDASRQAFAELNNRKKKQESYPKSLIDFDRSKTLANTRHPPKEEVTLQKRTHP